MIIFFNAALKPDVSLKFYKYLTSPPKFVIKS